MTMDEKYPWLKHLEGIANGIVATLRVKELSYGGSWQKRGGRGAFMMLARKWDRIENIVGEKHTHDIFQAVSANTGDITDDIDDLIGYLLLVRAKVKADLLAAADKKMLDAMMTPGEEPGPGYVNQDPNIPRPSVKRDEWGSIEFRQESSPPPHPKHKPLSGGSD